MKDRYLTIHEIAETLQVSYDTALSFVKQKVEYITVGRQYRVAESKLNAVLYPPKPVKQKIKSRPIYKIIERT